MENIELQTKLSAFSEEFNKAKVTARQTLWSKALLTSPLFSSAKLSEVVVESDTAKALIEAEKIKYDYNFKEVTFSKNACTIILNDKEDLEGSQYKSFIFYGYQLNVDLHYLILNYMVEILFNQFRAGDYSLTVAVDINTMIIDLGLDSKSKIFYREVMEDLNSRLAHSSSRFELYDGSVVNDKYVYKYSKSENGDFYTTVFGDVFIDSIIKDNWKQKINYLDQRALKGGTARYLFNYINMMARPIALKNGSFKKIATLSVNTVLKNSNFTGQRKTNIRTLNESLDYLKSIGFILDIEDEKNGGRSVAFKKILVNQKFNIKEFAEKELSRPKIKAESSVIDVVPVVVPENVIQVEPASVDDAIKKIEDDFFLKIGVNPESITPVAQADSDPSSVETDWNSWTNDKWDSEPQEEIEVIHDDLEEEFFEPDAFDLENARLFKEYA